MSNFAFIIEIDHQDFSWRQRKVVALIPFSYGGYHWKSFVNPLVPNTPFLYPLKTVRVSDVFRG